MKKRNVKEEVTNVCLRHLGISSVSEIANWDARFLNDSFRLDGLKIFKEIVDRFKNKPIWVMGDYDVDGITSTFIMTCGLIEYGCRNVSYRTPKRFSEGFGMNCNMISEAPEGSLIITVDNGIAALDAVRYAKERSCTVIVTDHHEANEELPEVDLIIDPVAIEDSSDFKGYCGAGIAYKIIRYLIGDEGSSKYLPYAAVATVADVMPLREENYIFVKRGLAYLPYTTAPGMKALLKKLGLEEHISETDVGYRIAPCLNAPGRLYDHGSMISLSMLFAGQKDAFRLAEKVFTTNEERKSLVSSAMKDARYVLSKKKGLSIPTVVRIHKVNEGIIGIVAGRLTDELGVPVIVLTESDTENVLKGSARSIEGENIKEILDKVSSLLDKYGGHAGAAGLSLNEANLDKFIKAIEIPVSNEVTDLDVFYDLILTEDELDEALEVIDTFAPFGEGNRPIIIKVPEFSVIPIRGVYKNLIGTDGVKMFGKDFTALGFGMAEKMANISKPEKVSLIGKLSFNYYQGQKKPQIEFSSCDVIKEVDGSANDTPFYDLLATMAQMKNENG